MLTKSELLKHPNFLLSTYQLEIYRQLSLYMKANDLKKKDVAEKLNVSSSYVSQILNGDFNFTLKKLIELGLLINKVPYLEFIEASEYWRIEGSGKKRFSQDIVYSINVGEQYTNVDPEKFKKIREILTEFSSTGQNQFVKTQNVALV